MSRAAYHKRTVTSAAYDSGAHGRKTVHFRRSAGNRLRSVLIVSLMVAAFFSGFFGHTLLNAHAEEERTTARNPYYTSVQLKQGDSLWNVARTYSKDSGYTVREYVDELKRMNHLNSEQVHAGEFLTVVYYEK